MIPGDAPVWLAALAGGLAMWVMVALRYLLASGLFAFATRLARPGLFAGLDRQIAREIRWSMLSALIYGAPTGLIIWGWRHHGWSLIYADPFAWPLWYMPLSVLVYLIAQDTWFYWSHRAMHTRWLFRLAHAVHHSSRPPTAWSAMSFHPIEALSGAIVLPVLVFLVPIHIAMIGVVLSVATVMGVTNHMGWEVFPRQLVHSPLGNWLITTSHHERHHEDDEQERDGEEDIHHAHEHVVRAAAEKARRGPDGDAHEAGDEDRADAHHDRGPCAVDGHAEDVAAPAVRTEQMLRAGRVATGLGGTWEVHHRERQQERPDDRDGDDGGEDGRAHHRQLVAAEAAPGQLPLAERLERDLVVGAAEIGSHLAQAGVGVVAVGRGGSGAQLGPLVDGHQYLILGSATA